jgi:hypothetical protein
MSKTILLTEAQYTRLQNVINENLPPISDEFKDFTVKVYLEFDILAKYVDGRYVYGVRGDDRMIEVMFDMDVSLRKWGIDEIGIYNVRGPKELSVIVELEPETDDDDGEVEHDIYIDWSKIELNTQSGIPRSIHSIIITLNEMFGVEKIVADLVYDN